MSVSDTIAILRSRIISLEIEMESLRKQIAELEGYAERRDSYGHKTSPSTTLYDSSGYYGGWQGEESDYLDEDRPY